MAKLIKISLIDDDIDENNKEFELDYITRKIPVWSLAHFQIGLLVDLNLLLSRNEINQEIISHALAKLTDGLIEVSF